MKKIVIGSMIGVALLLVVATPFFIRKPIRIINVALDVFSLPSLVDQVTVLRQENSDLRGQLLALQGGYSLPSEDKYLSARVFSLYPFNMKNRLYITIGSAQGTKTGEAVLFSKTALIGQIAQTFDNESEVITLFDPKFSVPVKIGKNGVDGLLEGGVTPQIGLIDKTKQIQTGDSVIAASKDLPFGLLVGSVKSVQEDSSGAFFKAQVTLPYVLSDINQVFVVKNVQ